jgi:signal peptidase I
MRTPEFLFGDARALQCELAADTLRSSGTLRLTVAGWSMVPTLWPGDALVIEAVDSSAVRSGEIVLFMRHRRFVAHRVIDKPSAGRGIETRGDAMRQMDSPVSNRELLGRVVSIERNGKSITPSRELNAASRSVAALIRHAPAAARVAVAMREALQDL